MNSFAGIVSGLAQRAMPLRLDLDAPLDDLEPATDRVRDAKVVALGSAVRHSHELLTLTHRVMRFLIEQHGFRGLSLEGDEVASLELDAYVRTGEGDPRTILARARPFWRFAEILDAVRWIRMRNAQYSNDPVHVVHVVETLGSTDDIERRLADTITAWHDRTGQKLVHWGGLAHTAYGNGLGTGWNAGKHLQARFGTGYVSTALTFHHGSLPSPINAPPADFLEAMLGAVDHEAFLLDIQSLWPESVQEWLNSPAKARLIGPGLHELYSPTLRGWFDVIIHSQQVTPANAL